MGTKRTLSDAVRDYGYSTVAELVRQIDISRATLNKWFYEKPHLLDLVLTGAREQRRGEAA